MKNLELHVDGLKCGGCIEKIKTAIFEEFQIDNIDINLDKKLVSILGPDDLSVMRLKSKIEFCGFSVLKMKRLQ